MAYDTLKAEIRQYIKTNGANEITGQILQNVLLDMVNAYPSLDGYATQQWVQNQNYVTSAELSGYATQQWVQNQLSGYLPLTGGNIDGNLSIYDTMNIYSSSIEWNDNGDYCRITFDDDGITVTAHGTGYVIANEFIKNGGTSSEFLKADGSVDSNTYVTASALTGYLPLTGGNLDGNLSIYDTMNIYSSSIEWNDNGDYCRITFDDDGITVTAHGTGYVVANSFIKTNGTSSQFLKADGSVDSNTYLTSSDISDMATQTWVGQQGFLTSVPSGYATETWVGNNYLPLTGGNLNGNLSIYGTMNIYSSSIEWNDNGDYCRITFDDDGITVTAHGTGYVTANEFIRNGGTSSQFLKADGSVDSNTYLTSASISDMATQTWVGQQGFLTSVPSGYATETWVGNNYLPLTGGTITSNLAVNGEFDTFSRMQVNGTSADKPFFRFHIPNVNWTRLQMDTYGVIHVLDGSHGTSYNGFACGNATMDSITLGRSTGGYGSIRFRSDEFVKIYREGSDDSLVLCADSTAGGGIVLSSSENNPVSIITDMQGGTSNTTNWYIYNSGDAQFVSVTQTSDIRRKNIISDIGMSIDDIAKAPMFRFTMKDDDEAIVRVGTSAQYWKTVIPEVVSEDKRGVLGLQYDVAALAGVITVAKRVVDHEQRIAELEKENALLKARLNIN